jgi:cap2 methyltransferase
MQQPDWLRRENNPHCEQYYVAGEVNDRQRKAISKGAYPFERELYHNNQSQMVASSHSTEPEISKIIHPESKQSAYRRRKGELKTVIHWGQRKLLLSEIEFLTLFAPKGNAIVVYAGAAPGSHITLLLRLFPDIKFILYDPNRFNRGLQSFSQSPDGQTRVDIHQCKFTQVEAQTYENQNILFLSDIRTANSSMTNEQSDERIDIDNQMQMEWIKIMKPRASMIKFRFPYHPLHNTTPYFDGKVFLPVWGPQTTTETRMIVEDYDKMTDWDIKKYESKFAVFVSCTCSYVCLSTINRFVNIPLSC